ncbi:acyl-CoA thioesterase [Kitasatospora griseola]|uniref:acyl-CoA thioesterase n=1 Tax=Kitasatospora griseola TaxID=2064 RepID=UPI003662B710
MADQTVVAVTAAAKPVQASQVTLAHIMSEHDTNLYGTIHGGVVMKLIDDAAGAAAARHAEGPAVTAAVDSMAFLAPVRAGDLLTAHAELERAGRTSMTVHVTVTAERWNAAGPVTRVATGRLTFVAIDAESRPRPVPALLAAEPAEVA